MTVRLERRPGALTAQVRVRSTRAALARVLREAEARLAGVLLAQRVNATGPLFHHLDGHGATVVVDVGVPVDRAVRADQGVVPGYRAPVDSIEVDVVGGDALALRSEAEAVLGAWASEHGVVLRPGVWIRYRVAAHIHPDPARWVAVVARVMASPMPDG